MLKNQERNVATAIFLIGILLLGLDVSDDLRNGAPLEHIAEEALIVLFCVVGVLALWFRYFKSRLENLKIKTELKSAKEDLDKFKNDTAQLTGDINKRIHEQFQAWSFSDAEKEIAMLVLKGMTVKEISEFRKTSEKTVTQQLSSIYQKSKLHGRAELSAFFLEDIFS